MVERIRMLLETRQLTPTQFADAIGVARPIVSHILSGRNKPSLDVVQRILAAMPDLSMPWLLNGTGPMQAGGLIPPQSPLPEAPKVQIAPEKVPLPSSLSAQASTANSQQLTETEAPKEPVLPINRATSAPRPHIPIPRFTSQASKSQAKADAPEPIPEPILAAEPALSQAQMPPPVAPPELQVAPDGAASAIPAPALDADGATAAALFAGTEKPIRRIVISYRDGSFADYQPE